MKDNYKPEQCFTVGEVIKALEKLPSKTEVHQGFTQSVDVVMFNQNTETCHVRFEDGGDWCE